MLNGYCFMYVLVSITKADRFIFLFTKLIFFNASFIYFYYYISGSKPYRAPSGGICTNCSVCKHSSGLLSYSDAISVVRLARCSAALDLFTNERTITQITI